MDVVDVGARDLRLDDQRHVGGQDLHDRLAAFDDAAGSVVIGTHDGAGDRRVDGDAVEHAACLAQLFADRVEVAFEVLQLFEGLLLVGFLGLVDLLFELDDLGAGLGDFGGQAADLAFGVGHGALDRLDLGGAQQALVEQDLLAGIFFLHQDQLAFDGVVLLLVAIGAIMEGGDVLLQQADLALQLAAGGIEVALLTVDDRLDLGVLEIVGDVVGE